MQHQQISIEDADTFLACRNCDLLLPKVQIERGKNLICPRCGTVVYKQYNNTLTRSFYISLGGLILFFPAVSLPLMTFNVFGMKESGNILQTIQTFMEKEYLLVALTMFFSIVLFPLVKFTSLAFVSFCLLKEKRPRFLRKIFKLCDYFEEWAMMEIFLLGIMVTIIKMYHSAEISFGIGFYCLIGLVILTLLRCTNREEFWRHIENGRKQKTAPPPSSQNYPMQYCISAAERHLIRCKECGKLSTQNNANQAPTRCKRCHSTLHMRKPHAIAITWVLVITAALLFFPANMMPIMRVQFLGIPSSSTIIDGIIIFFQDGSWFIALVILSASILIPLFKIAGLAILLCTVHFKRPYFLKQKTAMFRFIVFIGRWSMLDIFVVALLGYYMDFRFFTSIKSAPGAIFFCLVVVTTMIAAMIFDPRIMWDMQTKLPDHACKDKKRHQPSPANR